MTLDINRPGVIPMISFKILMCCFNIHTSEKRKIPQIPLEAYTYNNDNGVIKDKPSSFFGNTDS